MYFSMLMFGNMYYRFGENVAVKTKGLLKITHFIFSLRSLFRLSLLQCLIDSVKVLSALCGV